MSLLIEGMEMPKEDEEIIIRIDPSGTVMTQYALPISWAKAVSVPPHGDLVDRAEMREIAISLLDEAVTDQEAYAIRKMWSRLGQMPVYIPEEGGE